ncbi:helix-turn-helix transcriptional regulator [Nocardia sp. NPDC049707]|uniref:helix-turn-helix domain-containing protein n=1 Tax=Nocardia sp. NPDC049707 TaxID=3154735 RepID=UPI003430F6B5
MDSAVGSTLPRRLLARELRRLRESAGLGVEVARRAITCSAQTLWRMETGQSVRLRPHDIEKLGQVYRATPDEVKVLLNLTEEAQQKGWWHAYDNTFPKFLELYLGLETSAVRLTTYQAELIPGLLQTPEYLRALIWAWYPNLDTAEVEARIELRIKRQARLTYSHDPLIIDVTLGETALRLPIGGPAVMADQLRHLAEMTELPNVTVRVVPTAVGAHRGLNIGPFVLLEFPAHPTAHLTEPPIIHCDGYTGSLYLEKPEEIEKYRGALREIKRSALDEAESRALISRIAKELAQ